MYKEVDIAIIVVQHILVDPRPVLEHQVFFVVSLSVGSNNRLRSISQVVLERVSKT